MITPAGRLKEVKLSNLQQYVEPIFWVCFVAAALLLMTGWGSQSP
ncbi:hypothetical protein [Alienimonas californiensis]|nr:hypothetical protein [Alienimonas californiensis]